MEVTDQSVAKSVLRLKPEISIRVYNWQWRVTATFQLAGIQGSASEYVKLDDIGGFPSQEDYERAADKATKQAASALHRYILNIALVAGEHTEAESPKMITWPPSEATKWPVGGDE